VVIETELHSPSPAVQFATTGNFLLRKGQFHFRNGNVRVHAGAGCSRRHDHSASPERARKPANVRYWWKADIRNSTFTPPENENGDSKAAVVMFERAIG
jgi:hypothetical protein